MPMHALGLLGMPRRVFTYPAGLGCETLNLVSTVGAFVLAAGFAVVVWDVVRPKRAPAARAAQPLGRRHARVAAGDARASRGACGPFPRSTRRYPLWDQPELRPRLRRGPLLPARCRRRPARDAGDQHRRRRRRSSACALPDRPSSRWSRRSSSAACSSSPPSSSTRWLAVSAVLALAAILVWLWTGTGEIPEKETKDVGLGLTLPLYLSRTRLGRLVGDVHHDARASSPPSSRCVFGYFFYWTLDERLPAATPSTGPGAAGRSLGAPLVAASWALTVARRRWNAAESRRGLLRRVGPWPSRSARSGSAALVGTVRGDARLDPSPARTPPPSGCWSSGASCTSALGVVMQLYCVARRLAGRMTARHDIDIGNVDALLALHRRHRRRSPWRSSAAFPRSGEPMTTASAPLAAAESLWWLAVAASDLAGALHVCYSAAVAACGRWAPADRAAGAGRDRHAWRRSSSSALPAAATGATCRWTARCCARSTTTRRHARRAFVASTHALLALLSGHRHRSLRRPPCCWCRNADDAAGPALLGVALLVAAWAGPLPAMAARLVCGAHEPAHAGGRGRGAAGGAGADGARHLAPSAGDGRRRLPPRRWSWPSSGRGMRRGSIRPPAPRRAGAGDRAGVVPGRRPGVVGGGGRRPLRDRGGRDAARRPSPWCSRWRT